MVHLVIDKGNAKHFKEFASKKPTIVLYHAHWCGHCVQFKPTWDAFVKKLQSSHLKDRVHSSECEHAHLPHMPKGHGEVQMFPTIELIHKGKKYEYTQPRDEAHLMAFVEKHSAPATPAKAAAKPAKPVRREAGDKASRALLLSIGHKPKPSR